MARKKDFMKFEFLKDLSGKTPEEIAANGRFTEEEAKVISGAKIAVEQALELLKKKDLDEDVINVSKDILVGNVSVETVDNSFWCCDNKIAIWNPIRGSNNI